MINYSKKVKFYDTSKKPKRQALWTLIFVWIISKLSLIGKEKQIEKINMENLKPPYLLLCNHLQFTDFKIASLATWPHRLNNIVAIDGYYKRAWLMETVGSICKRKFVNDVSLYRQISYVLKDLHNIVGLYPEARYTPVGTTGILPESLSKMIKLLNEPVVALIYHGHYLHAPFWDYKRKRKVPFYATLKQILTKEQIKNLSVEEINEIVHKELAYDEYLYQLENNIHITEKFRAEGLHKVLYKCTECGEESMTSHDYFINCPKCNSEWELKTNGQLEKVGGGETKFTHVPSWFEWQREEIKREILSGKYLITDSVDVYGFPHPKELIYLGAADFTHNKNGYSIKGHYNGQDYSIEKAPLENYGVYVEYDWEKLKEKNGKDLFSLSTLKDTFFFFPHTQKNIITKLSLATEELYKMAKSKMK